MPKALRFIWETGLLYGFWSIMTYGCGGNAVNVDRMLIAVQPFMLQSVQLFMEVDF